MSRTCYRFGQWTLDEGRRVLLHGAEPVHLSRKAFDLLDLLLAAQPIAVSKQEIEERLWPSTFVSEASLTKLMAEIRSALEDDPRDPRFIRTVHGFGYAFCGGVTLEPAPSGAEEEMGVERSPYPGLAAFAEEDAGSFFGREAEVEALWAKIRRRRLLGLIGPSGVGKTSFLRAGVLPEAPMGWACLLLTPGTRPSLALARALVSELAGDVKSIERLLSLGSDEIVAVFAQWRRRHAEALVVVDQLEELFTLNLPEVQAAFADCLGRLVAEADVHVLLSVRDDFLFPCHEYAGLSDVFADLTPLGPLKGEALARALVEPARREGYRFEDDALAEELLASVAEERGALPLLAFATARLWEKRDRERRSLTRAAYAEIGGVAGALAQHAEATLERIGPARQTLVREIFRNLVTGQGTRAVTEREELLSAFPDRPAAEEVLRQLVDARLLTTYEEEGAEGQPAHHRIELVHESLLSAWPRLVRWQAQDQEGALLRDQLKQAAHLWGEKGLTSDLLWTGTAYREFALWRERYPGVLTALEEDFARAMTDKARRRRRIRRLVVGSIVAAAALVAAVTGLLWRRSEAARDRALAEVRRAEASKLIALGRAELDRYPTAAVAYGRHSLEVADTPEGRRFVVDALWRSPTARILSLGSEVVWAAEFSPDGRWVAGYAFQGHLMLVPNDGGPVRVLPGPSPTGGAPDVGFTPGGEAVLTWADEEKFVRMWSVPDGREVRRFEPRPPLENAALVPPSVATGSRRWIMLPQGNLFFWWWPEGPLRASARVPFGIWPFDGGPPILMGSWPAETYPATDPGGTRLLALRGRRLVLRPLAARGDTVEQLVATVDDVGLRRWFYGFSGQGDHIWFYQRKDETRRLLVWPLEARASSEPRVLSIPNPDVNYSVPSWESAGSRLAWSSSADQAVWVWDLAGPPDAAPIVLRRPDMVSTKKAVFAPAHDWLAVAHQATLTFWALAQPQARLLTGHRQSVTRLVFTPDAQSLVSCGQDGVRLWPLGPGRGGMRRTAADYRGWCVDAALAPDGERMVLVGTNGAWLAPSIDGRGHWLAGGSAPGTPEYDAWPYFLPAVAWDASGRRVAVASAYTTSRPNAVALFDLATGGERWFSLAPPGETGPGFDWGVWSLAFTPEGRLLAGGSGGVRWLDPGTGASSWIWRLPKETNASIAVSGDGRRLAATATQMEMGKAARAHGAVLVDLATGVVKPLHSHGRAVTAVAFDTAGRTLVTGDEEGVVRVGLWDGGEPHRLCCHGGSIKTITVSPGGRWIASASGGEIRLWPMPELSKPPLHTLPYDELMAKLRAMTNLQVVEDSASPTGYKLEIGPFPGWKDVPTW